MNQQEIINRLTRRLRCPYCRSDDLTISERGPIRSVMCVECEATGIQVGLDPMEWVTGKTVRAYQRAAGTVRHPVEDGG